MIINRNMKVTSYIVIFAVAAFILSSCTKQVAGPTGLTGPAGPQGPSSSYNVIFDSISTTKGWSPDGSGLGYAHKFANLTPLANTGTAIVDVFFTAGPVNSNQAQYIDLPVGNIITAGDALNYSYSPYTVTIDYYDNGAGAPPFPTAYTYYKIVIISQP